MFFGRKSGRSHVWLSLFVALSKKNNMSAVDPFFVSDADVDEALNAMGFDLFVPDSTIEHLVRFLPVELKENVEHFYNWNESLLPELQYRMEVAFTEVDGWYEAALAEKPHPAWLNWILSRITEWVNDMNVDTGYALLRDIRAYNLNSLGDTFQRVLEYNY